MGAQLKFEALGAHFKFNSDLPVRVVLIPKVRINWRYASGEIAIIVIGILIAITLDNCNDERIARRREREYLVRLAEDLRTDTATFSFVDRALQRKTAALALADSIVNRGVPLRDTLTFLQAVVGGANFAWNQPRIRTTTFEDLQSTGNLRLVRNQSLRAQMVQYYTSAEGDYLRIAGRRTKYGPLTYELVPRKAEFALDSATARAMFATLVRGIVESELSTAIVAERNLAVFLGEMNTGLHRRAVDLLESVDRRE